MTQAPTFMCEQDTTRAVAALSHAYYHEVNSIASRAGDEYGTVSGDPFTYYDAGRALGLLRALSIVVDGAGDSYAALTRRLKEDIRAARITIAEQRGALYLSSQNRRRASQSIDIVT